MLLKKFPVASPAGLNGVRHIAYTEWGAPDNSHVVICAHGLTRNCRDFDFLAQALAADCRVICVDVVGRGQSDWLANAADYDHFPLYLTDAAALLAHIGVAGDNQKIVDWVGVSMGGLIGMMLAIQALPHKPIHRLVISDIGPLIPAAAIARMADYVGKDPRFTSFEAFETYMKMISVSFGPLTDAQWHHLAIHSARKYDDDTYGFRYDPGIAVSFKKPVFEDIALWSQWDVLTVPTLVLRGMNSDVLHPDIAAAMQVRGPKAQVIELPGIGHAPMLVSDDQIAIVKDFLLRTH